jgi:shikimate kinase
LKNIFLIGMPSSGKTTLGKELARHIRYRFLDTDALIVREEGLTINELFASKGEGYFRTAEARVLRAIRPNSKLIVSTGGGMPCFYDNMAYIKQHGISVFLDVSPEIIAERMQRHSINDRPLFDKDSTELVEVLRKKYTERYPVYSEANIRINGETDAKDLVKLLESALSR